MRHLCYLCKELYESYRLYYKTVGFWVLPLRCHKDFAKINYLKAQCSWYNSKLREQLTASIRYSEDVLTSSTED